MMMKKILHLDLIREDISYCPRLFSLYVLTPMGLRSEVSFPTLNGSDSVLEVVMCKSC